MTADRDERLRRLSPERRALLQRMLERRREGLTPDRPAFSSSGDETPMCSFAQERFWVLEQLDPGCPAHHIAGALRFRGALDVAALRVAVNQVVERHETLRTAFELRGGALVPVLREHQDLPVSLERLPGASEEGRSQILRELVEEPFDLTTGPLIRNRLVQWDEETFDLLLCVHHIAADGLSMRIMAAELESACGGRPLPAMDATYAGFAAWQRGWLTDEVLEPGLRWWSRQLHDLPVHELPPRSSSDQTAPLVEGRAQRQLDGETVAALRSLARSSGATPFMVTLSAWSVVLGRLFSTDDIAVGVPWSGRDIDQVRGVVGFFVNSLVLRVDLSEDPTFEELLARTRKTVTDAQARAHVPFERLVDAMNPDRDLERNPLFTVGFNWLELAAWRGDFPGGVAAEFEWTRSGSLLDMTLFAHVDGDRVCLELEYAPGRVSANAADRWLAHVEAVLAAAARRPQDPVHLLPVPDPERRWLEDASVGAPWPLAPVPVLDAIRVHANRAPTAAAVTCGRTVTYEALMSEVEARAEALRSEGVRAGDLRVVSTRRGLSLVVEMLALWSLRAAWVPLDPDYPEARRRFVEGEVSDGGEPAPEGTAYVTYTSGSTGQPKGVVVSHQSLENLLASMAERPGLTPDDVLLAVTTVSFDISILELMLPLYVGARVVIATEEQAGDGRRLGPLLDEVEATVMQATPATWRMLLHAGWSGRSGLRAWCGGEALTQDLAGQLAPLTASLWNLYGPTETCIWSTVSDVGDGPVSIGRPIHGTILRLVDRRGRVVPRGVEGELWIGGAGVATGYWRRDALTEERFVLADHQGATVRFYRTGDRVRWTERGGLMWAGRLDDQVKVRGFRVEPGEVESALLDHPWVREAVCAVRADEAGDERLVAWVVPQAEAEAAPMEDLRAHMRERLPAYLIPDLLSVIEAMPLTANGKVDRGALRVVSRAASTSRQPQTAVERALIRGWSALLGVEAGVDDDWFALGGHSLLATQLMANITTELGVTLPLRALFDAPTLGDLAKMVETAAQDDLVPMEVHGAEEVSSAQERLWFLHELNPQSAAYNMGAALRLRGPLDEEALAAALQDVAERHPSLRTTLPERQGRPGLSVSTTAPVSLVPVPAAREAASERVLAQLHEPFDLRRGPLWRCALWELAEDEHFLVLVLHHVIADAWSVSVLTADLAAAYDARRDGRPWEIPAPAVTPGEWAAWRRREASRENGDERWWRDALIGVDAAVELPLDRDRPPLQSHVGGQRRHPVPAPLWRAVEQTARSLSATPFEVLLAGVQALLWRLTASREVVVGTSVAERERPEVRDLAGCLINALPLRLKLDPAWSFADLVKGAAAVARDARARQGVPFERIVELAEAPRDLSRPPLFQVSLDLIDLPELPSLPGLEVTDLDLLPETCKLDLGWRFERRGDAVSCVVEWCSALLDEETVQRWWSWLMRCLEAAVGEPDEQIVSLPFMDEDEREALVRCGRGATPEPSEVASLHGLVLNAGATDPDAPAIIHGEAVTTFAALEERSLAVARGLLESGVRPGDRVGVLAVGRPEALVGLLGVSRAGAAYVPLDPDHPEERLRYLVQDAALSRVLVCDEADVGRLPWLGERATALSSLHGDSQAALPDVAADDPAYVLYTSGSTGEPKGVVVPHRAVLHYVRWAVTAYGLTGGDGSPPEPGGAPLHTSLAFDLSLTSFLVPWCAGRPAVLTDDLESALRQGGFDLVKATPSHLALIPEELVSSRATRVLVVGGEPLTGDRVAPWLRAGVRVVNEYGPTEATVGCTFYDVTEVDGPVPIGAPITGTDVRVVGESGELLPPGCPGELVVSGPGVALGYHQRAALTGDRFQGDEYRTGDVVRWVHGGVLQFLRRDDGQVKVRGVRVEVGEVEHALRRCEGVRDAAVIADQHESGTRLLAYVVSERAGDEVRRDVAERLPAASVPAFVMALKSLPLTGPGKLDRSALPAPRRAAVASDSVSPPRDAREATLARLAASVLGLDAVGVDDGFFELGGDSIRALEFVSRARGEGMHLEVRDVFQHPTPATLAAVAAAAPATEAEQGPVTGVVPLLPIQRWWLSFSMPDPGRWHQGVRLSLGPDACRDRLEQALGWVVRHHDLLRATVEPDGAALHVAAPPPGPPRFPIRDDDGGAPRADLRRGPLLDAAWSQDDKGSVLELAAHHLVVDAVSWRVLVEDLVRVERALAADEEPSLPLKTTSFRSFADALLEEAEGGDGERAFWAQEVAPVREVPLTHTVGDPGELELVLPGGVTETLLTDANRPWRTHPSEVVLAAAARALGRITGDDHVLVDVEGHGRGDPEDGPDVSRTVGWFTSMQPCRLRVTDDVSSCVRGVKERLRTVPGGGMGYGALRWLVEDETLEHAAAAPLLFNWLGDLVVESDATEDGVVRRAEARFGLRGSNPLTHLMILDVGTRDGCLVLRLQWDGRMDRSSVDAFEVGVRQELIEAASVLGSQRHQTLTPSDVPLADVGQGALDVLLRGRENTEDVFPLTPTQRGMVLHALYDPSSSAYIEQLVTVISGELDPRALRVAYGELARACPLLRASVAWRGLPRPHWVVDPESGVPWEEVHLDAGDDSAGQQLDALVLADRARGLDLERGPLMRCTLAHLPDRKFALLLTWHHAALDGWSLPLALQRVNHAYDAARSGESPAPIPSPPFQEYVRWLERQDQDPARRWFHDLLGDFGEATPCDLRVHGDSGDGERELMLETGPSQALFHGAGRLGVTVGSLAQAAWAVVLGRVAGREDVVFGATVSGRTPELRHMDQRLGCFVNTLPVRVRLDPDMRRVDWLREVQRQLADSSRFEHAPLTLTQGESAVAPGSPLFESLVVVENYPVKDALDALRGAVPADAPWARPWDDLASEQRGPLTIEDVRTYERTSYGLTLVVVPGDRVVLRLIWGDGFADPDGAERTLTRVSQVMRELAMAPDASLGSLEVLLSEERRQLAALQRGPEDAPWVGPVQRRIFRGASEYGGQAAVDEGGKVLSYRGLAARARGLAASLTRQGVGPGDVVGVCLPRGADFVAALLGVMESGAAWMPLDPDLPAQRRTLMSEQVGATCVLQELGSVDPVREHREVALSADDAAYVLFTSGTSGLPKAVTVNHRSIAAYARSAADRFALAPDDRVLHFAAPGFDTGLEELLPTLLVGATVVPRTTEMLSGGPAFLREVRRLEITVLDLPTTFWHELVLGWVDGDELPPSVRLVVLGGEAVRADCVARWRDLTPDHVRLVNTYGPTEATIVSAWCDVDSPVDVVPMGVPVPGADLRVMDERARRLPPGAVGELWIGGVGVAAGYLNDQTLTEERFVAAADGGRFYRTGDRVRWTTDGQLLFMGRVDRQAKIRGQRVEPEEVERVLEGHPEVVQAAVDVRSGPTGPTLMAWAVTATETSGEALVEWLGARLPEVMVPHGVTFLPELPIGPTGKLRREDLVTADVDDPPADEPPVGELESTLVRVFEDTFQVTSLGRHAHFFDLGGDSLTAVRLMTRLEREGLRPTLKDLFEGATPARIAAALSGDRASVGEDAGGELEERAVLEREITGVGMAPVANRPPWSVMLTGATGFLGAHLIQQLLTQTDAEVVALVRDRNERRAMDRLRSHLKRHGCWSLRAEARVRVVLGDLQAPRLGLDPEVWDALAEEVDVIWHAGAVASFIKPYEQLEAANVGGTVEVLRLATTTRLKVVQHVSTIGVFDVLGAGDDGPVREDADLLEFQELDGGYAQTKWVAERLVWKAADRGVPVTVHRPGRLVGDSRTGLSNADDLAAHILRACLDCGSAPEVDGLTDATPVDFAAHAMVTLGVRDESRGRAYHIVNPSPVRLADLVSWLRERRPDVGIATLDAWLETLGAAPEAEQVRVLLPLMAAASSVVGVDGASPVSGEVTADRLQALGLNCPAVDAAFVQRVLEHIDPSGT